MKAAAGTKDVARRSRPSMAQRKAQFVTWFKDRFVLRFHMAMILGLTFLAGLAVTKLLLVAGNTNLAVRYGMAVTASYAAFLLLLKLWLLYVVKGEEPDEPDAVDVIDAADGVVDVLRDLSGPTPSGFRAAGGGYGGGGGSASFGEPEGSSGASLVADADEGFGLVLLAAVVLIGVALAGGYLIYAGPTILAEAAFEALLASALIPGARRAEAAGWMRPAVRATVLPFLAMFALAVGFGWVAAGVCPEARRVVDVIACGEY
jgi:hypothetical protein